MVVLSDYINFAAIFKIKTTVYLFLSTSFDKVTI